LSEKRKAKKGDDGVNAKPPYSPRARVLAITSGKGGVGKTNIVANIGYALTKLGKKVMILDADLGLGNLDVLLGLAPKYNFSHVLSGSRTIPEIIKTGPGDMQILPAASGIQELTQLSVEQQVHILKELDRFVSTVDYLLIDTAAGISNNVMYFNVSAHEIFVVVSPEPTAITDAYALMKVLSLKYKEKQFRLIVNSASSEDEAEEVFRQLNLVADRFLDISIDYCGYVLFDRNITKGVRHQRVVSELYPGTPASRCFTTLAKTISETPSERMPEGESNFFWNHLIQERLE